MAGQQNQTLQQGDALAAYGVREANKAIVADDYALAAGILEPILRLRPGNAEAHASLAYCLSHLERHAEAASHYERSLALDPGNITNLVLAALGAVFADDLKRAATLARLALSLDPKSEDASEVLRLAEDGIQAS